MFTQSPPNTQSPRPSPRPQPRPPNTQSPYWKSHMGFSKNPLLDPYNPRWLRSAILKIDMTSFFSAEGGPIWITFRRLIQNDMPTAMMCGNGNHIIEFQYGGRLGKLNGMSSHSHVSHCRVCHLVNSLSRFQSHMPHCRV